MAQPANLISYWIEQHWHLMLTCRGCGRVTTFDTAQLLAMSRGPDDTVHRIVDQARCRQCSARNPYLSIVDTRPGEFEVVFPPG